MFTNIIFYLETIFNDKRFYFSLQLPTRGYTLINNICEYQYILFREKLIVVFDRYPKIKYGVLK